MNNTDLASVSSKPKDWREWSDQEWRSVTEEEITGLYCGPESNERVDALGRTVLMAALEGGCAPGHLRKLFFMSLAWQTFVDLMALEDRAGVRMMAYLVRYLSEDRVIGESCWVLLKRNMEKLHMFPVINSQSQGLLYQLYVLALRARDQWNWFPQGNTTVSHLPLHAGQWQAGISERLVNRFTANGVLSQTDPHRLPNSLYGVGQTLTRPYYFDRESGRICLWLPSVERLVRVCEWTRLLVQSVDIDNLDSFLDTNRNLLDTFEDLKPDLSTLWCHMDYPEKHIVRAVLLERRHHMHWVLFVKSLPPHPSLSPQQS